MTSFAGLDVVVARTSRERHSTAIRPRQSSTVAHLRTLATPSALHQAVARLRQAPVDVMAYASTTSGYAIGHAAEVDLTGRLRQMAGVPVVSSGLAATQATAFVLRARSKRSNAAPVNPFLRRTRCCCGRSSP
jgi:maleate isomerase